MPHHPTVLHALIKQIPWDTFDSLVETHGSDRRVRRLSSRSQLIALLYGQLSGAQSLREIEAGLAAQAPRLSHLGARPPARSTLADANATRPAALFEALFGQMAAQAGRQARRAMGEGLRILDATRIALSPRAGAWARGPKGKASIKLHLVYEGRAQVPLEARTSGPRVNDITPAWAAEIRPGATYVFDLGYYSFDWWGALEARGCRFVTRLKAHTRTQELACHPLPAEAEELLSDRTVRLLSRHDAALRRDLREVVVRLESGKTLRLVTNDLEAPAREIADLYRARWQVELFFKWIKQKLKLRHFLGRSENALRCQIFVALIAYLLIRCAHRTQSAVPRLATFATLISLNLMHRRPITALTDPPPKPEYLSRQTEMIFA